MKTTITTAGDFVRAVEVTPIDAAHDSYSVQFFSQLRSARNPQDWQTNFDLILGAEDMKALSDVFTHVLSRKVNAPVSG